MAHFLFLKLHSFGYLGGAFSECDLVSSDFEYILDNSNQKVQHWFVNFA